MNKINDFFSRICIYDNKNIYKLFTLGYYQDGGYFITDLSVFKNYEYHAIKFKIDGKHIRKLVKYKYNKENSFLIKLNRPKISHHIDGNAHISGSNITSGYFQDGKGKGLYIKSLNLNGYNDGGPMFCFNFGLKMLDLFPIIDINNSKLYKKLHFLIPGEKAVDLRKNKKDKFNYIIEGYYIHKNDLPDDFSDSYVITKKHPIYGSVQIFPLISPKESPYIFGILCIKDPLCEDEKIFSYTGAPGLINNDGSWEVLGLSLEEKNKIKTINILDR